MYNYKSESTEAVAALYKKTIEKNISRLDSISLSSDGELSYQKATSEVAYNNLCRKNLVDDFVRLQGPLIGVDDGVYLLMIHELIMGVRKLDTSSDRFGEGMSVAVSAFHLLKRVTELVGKTEEHEKDVKPCLKRSPDKIKGVFNNGGEYRVLVEKTRQSFSSSII